MTRNTLLALAALLLASPASFYGAQAMPATTPAPSSLPGKGLAEHDFFYAGEAKEENMYIVKSGRIVWSYTHPGRGEISDAILLPNNNVLFAHQYAITEVSADKRSFGITTPLRIPRSIPRDPSAPIAFGSSKTETRRSL